MAPSTESEPHASGERQVVEPSAREEDPHVAPDVGERAEGLVVGALRPADRGEDRSRVRRSAPREPGQTGGGERRERTAAAVGRRQDEPRRAELDDPDGAHPRFVAEREDVDRVAVRRRDVTALHEDGARAQGEEGARGAVRFVHRGDARAAAEEDLGLGGVGGDEGPRGG